MKALFKLIRPHHWVKNIFIFVPLFFNGNIFRIESLWSVTLAFIAFSLAASSIYCFNDILDVEADRQHPVKKHRPIASGIVSVSQAYILMAGLLLLSGLILIIFHSYVGNAAWVIAGYWLLNMAYCFRLKQYSLVDVFLLSLGFVLRIFTGGLAGNVPLSHWIVLMTFLLALFLAFAKRRDDVIRMTETGVAPRKNTHRYNLPFMDMVMAITSSVTLVCYVLYTVSPDVQQQWHSPYLYVTSVFVLMGLLRYLQLAIVDKKSGDPTKVALHDRFIQLIVLAWVAAFCYIIY